MILDQTAAGWSANLYALENSSVLKSAADIIDNVTETCSHRNFDQTCVLNGTCQREGLGSRASLCSDGMEPVSTLKDDLWNVGIGFYVIEDSRFLPESFLYSTRRFDTRHTSLAFDGCGKC